MLSITNTKTFKTNVLNVWVYGCVDHILNVLNGTKYRLIRVIWVRIIKRIPTSSITIATSSSTSQLLCAALTSCRSTVLANVNVHVHVRYNPVARPSVVRLSSVCNVRAPYSAGWNFRQYFFAIWYLGHPLTSTEILRRLSQGNLSVGEGVKGKRGSQI